MPTIRLFALLAVSVAGLLGGCGGGTDEVSLGSETGQSQVQRNKQRLDELERRVAELKRRRGEHGVDQSRAGGGALLDAEDRVSFDQLAQRLGGRVGVTVGSAGSPDSEPLGSLTTGKAWSTIKLALVGKVLEDAGGPGGLSAAVRQSIEQALTASDNDAAARLFDGLKASHGGLAGAAEAVGSVLREAGDEQTVISTQGRDGFSPYGQTDWSLVQQHRFMSRLAGGCVLDKASVNYILQLMGRVVDGQRWGLGSAGLPARFKGGWGPGIGGGYLVRQVGLLEPGGGKGSVVVALAAEPASDDFAAGTQMLSELAKWVAANVNADAAGGRGC